MTPQRRWGRTIVVALLILVAIPVIHITIALLVYPSQYVYRVLAWRDSDAFDWQKFPSHRVTAAPTTYHFAEKPAPETAARLATLAGVDDWESFLTSTGTQAFIVVQDGAILYEQYFNDTAHDDIVTSFSVAKSFTSALIGIAIDEGYIGSVNDPITDYLPELQARDARFAQITLRDLLLMSSGLEYEEMRWGLFNGDDPLTTYYPDQRQIALENTRIVDPPGAYFQYNKYHPQLLGMILERATSMPVADYLQEKLWHPLGMEFDGSWSTDSEASDFEKMETGVNARAVDFAKFGQLFLDGGSWNGEQVISAAWVTESTLPYLPADNGSYYPIYFESLPGQGYYTYMWWGMARNDGAYDFMAEGDKGQFIYVSPSHRLVIVRNGVEFGIAGEEWATLFYRFAGAIDAK